MFTIELTLKEYGRLRWAASRGYFPKETYEAMRPLSPLDEGETTTWFIPDWAAYGIVEQHKENSNSLFAGIAPGPLLDKLLSLKMSIVE